MFQRWMTGRLAAGIGAVALLVPTAAQARRQQQVPVPPLNAPPTRSESPSDPSGLSIPDTMEHSRQLQREKDRQRRMVEDADRLVKLASQYSASVQEHGGETEGDAKLLLQIERLARSVKDRMKGQ